MRTPASLFVVLASVGWACTGTDTGPGGSGLPDARVITSGNPDGGAADDDEDGGSETGTCPADQFACDESAATPVCVSEDQFCDGHSDCPGGEDESPEECTNPCAPDGGTAGSDGGSEATQWPCEDGTCLDEARFCDGHSDCPDGSDEDPLECA